MPADERRHSAGINVRRQGGRMSALHTPQR
jgi:hypothetical protein